MAFRHPALVVATTHRTLFGPAQALHMWWQFQICGTSSSGPLDNHQNKKKKRNNRHTEATKRALYWNQAGRELVVRR
jgi:hypothetical protein